MLTNVLIAESDPNERNYLRSVVGSCEGCAVIGVASDCQEAVQMTMQLRPHVVLVADDMAGMSGLSICETIVDLAPDVATAVIADSKTPDVIEAAMEAGARGVLARPLQVEDAEALISGLASIRERRDSTEILDLKNLNAFPKIITVTGAKGGIGKSTIACNLAVTLAKRFPGKVALVDMYTQFGDVATLLNVVPRRTFSDLQDVHRDMDKELLANYVTKLPCGLDVLAATDEPLPLDTMSPDCVDDILYLLKSNYRFTIIDMPQMLQEISLHILAQSHHVFLVSNLEDVSTVRGTKKFYDLLTGARMPRENIKVVLNRLQKSNPLTTEEVAEAFQTDAFVAVPYEPGLADAANEGVPFVIAKPNSPLSQSLAGMADDIIGEPRDSQTPQSASSEGGRRITGLFRLFSGGQPTPQPEHANVG